MRVRRLEIASIQHGHVVGGIKGLICAVITGIAILTPGFLSIPSLVATLDHASLIGLVALAMTFITISGNQLSLALGASMSASALAFVATSALGPWGAGLAALAMGVGLNAAQGRIVGYFGANPIIVSIAALGLITGIGTHLTGGGEVYPAADDSFRPYAVRLGLLDMSILVFLVGGALAETLLSATRFGRLVYAIGSNLRAAVASGINMSAMGTAVYAVAGCFCALAGIMAAARFQYASMEMGAGYDYDAFGAVLIGGTLLRGGFGSAWRTLIGVMILAAVHTILVLRGYSQEAQQLLTGVFILGAVCLSSHAEH
jgi:ribose/xylose/arabinose/galactoside ABC-type transport system permease subunit